MSADSAPLSPALAELAHRLQPFARSPGEDARWHDGEQRLASELEGLRQRWSERLAERAGPRIHRALLAFRIAPQAAGWRELRLACRGLARHADWEQRRLIDDERLSATLLHCVDALGTATPRWRGCVRALLAARREIDAPPPPACAHLDAWLHAALQRVHAAGNPPRWAREGNF